MIRTFILTAVVAAAAFSQEFTKAIEDNSFFIEEAYNQEKHVVQHNFTAAPGTGSGVEFSFTQEWPVFGRTHQFSFTIPYFLDYGPNNNGVGDIMLNYRYQAVDEPGFAFSPRISLIHPTGNNTKGFGNGTTGIQFNLPISKRFGNEFAAHGNAGMTYLPNAKLHGSAVTFTEYFLGGSVIYLANKSFNVIAELLYSNDGSSFGRSDNLLFSPGVRWAIDIGDLQIVPGLAFPFTFVSGQQSNGIFLYTSFEHFF
jgi:hypothetical protein